MSNRPIISYDDITLPYDPQPQPSQQLEPPPAKRNKPNGANSNGHHQQNWDDPNSSSTSKPTRNHQLASVPSKKNAKGKGSKGGASTNRGTVESSRELTHDEIWDDSALVDAWDAAMEEYRALNGPDKSWKEEPVHRSPLWYNTPKATNPDSSMQDLEGEATDLNDEEVYEDEGDYEDYPIDGGAETSNPAPQNASFQVPFNFDPSSAAADLANLASGSMVSQDEAFSRALNAMYWGGYYTAVYHCHRASNNSAQQSQPADPAQEEGAMQEGVNGMDEA